MEAVIGKPAVELRPHNKLTIKNKSEKPLLKEVKKEKIIQAEKLTEEEL